MMRLLKMFIYFFSLFTLIDYSITVELSDLDTLEAGGKIIDIL
jgi:hypothetical protein